MRTSDLGTVLDQNSTLVAHTNLKTRVDCNRLARQSFGMKKERKKKEEQNRNFQLSFFFSNLSKVSGTFGVDVTLEYKRKVVLRFLSCSASFFWESRLYFMYRRPL